MSALLSRPIPRARRGTWTFLHGGVREVCHVHLATEVDASALMAVRETEDGRIGWTALVVHAVAQAAGKFPVVRTLLRPGWLRPRLVELPDVDVKVLLDRTVDGERCVLPCTVEQAQDLTPADIQRVIDTYRTAPVDGTGPLGDVLRLQRLPIPLYRLVYGMAMRRTRLRSRIQGTVSVTSVGSEDVSLIHPLISGTLGFGVGRMRPTPVVRDGRVVAVPQFTLTLAFDHRVTDGAEAAAVLAAVKAYLEGGMDA